MAETATYALSCGLEELWIVEKHFRFPPSAPDYGHEVSEPLMRDVFRGIVALEKAPGGEYPVWATESDLLWLTRLIDPNLYIGAVPVGHRLLLKVITLLVEAEGEANYVYDDDEHQHRNAGVDTHADA